MPTQKVVLERVAALEQQLLTALGNSSTQMTEYHDNAKAELVEYQKTQQQLAVQKYKMLLGTSLAFGIVKFFGDRAPFVPQLYALSSCGRIFDDALQVYCTFGLLQSRSIAHTIQVSLHETEGTCTMVDYADIGKRIRACRLAKGMTQEQLANEVGVVVTHISHIETGNSVPSLKTLIDIINALDCSADELLCIEIKKGKAGVRQLDDRTACGLLRR